MAAVAVLRNETLQAFLQVCAQSFLFIFLALLLTSTRANLFLLIYLDA